MRGTARDVAATGTPADRVERAPRGTLAHVAKPSPITLPAFVAVVQDVDRDAPTPRLSGATSVFLTVTQELIAKVGERPGMIYDSLRARLQALEVTFQRWPADPPANVEARLAKIGELTELQGQIHALMRGDR